MSDELEQAAHSEDNAELCPIDELHILVTEEDINGENILAMSDFFSGYISHLASEVRSNGTVEVMSEIPIANIGIIADVLNQTDILMQGTTQLIPDFDSLPSDIKKDLNLANSQLVNREWSMAICALLLSTKPEQELRT